MKNHVKSQMNPSLIIRSLLALALALAFWSPIQAQSAKPEEGKNMTQAKMMERCQAMMEKKQKLTDDMKAQDAQLTDQLAKMNSAPEDKKMSLMAPIITLMAEQRIAMDARKAKMQEEMMAHMMQHMQMGKESMSQCPMMKDTMDMGGKPIAEGTSMTSATMMQRCQAMMEKKQKLMGDIKAQDAALAVQITKMNSAPEDKKIGLMASVITLMAEQRIAMDAPKAKMHEEMMAHMMQHMQMGKGSMSQCSMMKGTMDMDVKPADVKKEQK